LFFFTVGKGQCHILSSCKLAVITSHNAVPFNGQQCDHSNSRLWSGT